ncbi:MAG: D-Ala-D-Ala carboxypeptidase family metallohydrolase [Bacteroidota bacterium]
MDKKAFDLQFKNDASENRFTVDGDFIVFDKDSKLSYEVIPGIKLADLLTANPVSLTRINKTLLAALSTVLEAYGKPVTIRASYRSPEYNLLMFGQSDSQLYTTGDALALSVPENEVQILYDCIKEHFTGELGVYQWGVHIGRAKELKEWDYRSDTSFKRKLKDFVSNDKMKNIALIGAAAAAVWFFFIRKK